jgi:hypothetical protein
MYSNTLIFSNEKLLNKSTLADPTKITPYNSLFVKDSPRLIFLHEKIYAYVTIGVIGIYMFVKTLDIMLDTAQEHTQKKNLVKTGLKRCCGKSKAAKFP